MANLALVLATFAVLLLVTNASIYRTTIEINDYSQQSCREQIQQQQQLNNCQDYLFEQLQQSGRSRGRRNQLPHLRECCQQLQKLDSQCRCQGLKEAVQQKQQEEGLQGQEGQEMFELAMNLAGLCRIPPMGCGDMRSSWLF